MSIKKFITEFQDNLFNLEPLYDRLDTKIASKTDYYGAHRNATDILNEFEESSAFLEKESATINKEVSDILESLNNKLDRIDTFASAIMGVNSSKESGESILTINPYLLNTHKNWESIERCLLLPILSTYNNLKSYSSVSESGKGFSRFKLSSEYSTKYISVLKQNTTQILSIVFLDDMKSIIETKSFPDNINKTNVLVEIPISTSYFSIEYYYDVEDNITVTPLTYKHSQETVISLGSKTYKYGNVFVVNSSTDLPRGCFASLQLDMSFKDINDKELENVSVSLPLDSDGFTTNLYKDVPKDATIRGYWLDGMYSENLQDIPEHAHCLYKEKLEGFVTAFTESSLKLNVSRAKSITITSSLKLSSFNSQTQSPRIYSITGITKNV